MKAELNLYAVIIGAFAGGVLLNQKSYWPCAANLVACAVNASVVIWRNRRGSLQENTK